MVVALRQHRGDLGGHGAIMEVMHGGGETPLSAVRPCGMGVTPWTALDIYGSPQLTIFYLLRGECRNPTGAPYLGPSNSHQQTLQAPTLPMPRTSRISPQPLTLANQLGTPSPHTQSLVGSQWLGADFHSCPRPHLVVLPSHTA